MPTVDFKFAIGEHVYVIRDLNLDNVLNAMCYTVMSAVIREKGDIVYDIGLPACGWVPECDLIAANQAENYAIDLCNRLMHGIKSRARCLDDYPKGVKE